MSHGDILPTTEQLAAPQHTLFPQIDHSLSTSSTETEASSSTSATPPRSDELYICRDHDAFLRPFLKDDAPVNLRCKASCQLCSSNAGHIQATVNKNGMPFAIRTQAFPSGFNHGAQALLNTTVASAHVTAPPPPPRFNHRVQKQRRPAQQRRPIEAGPRCYCRFAGCNRGPGGISFNRKDNRNLHEKNSHGMVGGSPAAQVLEGQGDL